ncbi:hypothetical protein GGR56DRAFT_689753 [Xylariaceae sp. FL0804]|nr:hypothetical protein GGR56DRAFT_689753 [Xylariaceae sp. FL0804]
MDSDDDYHPESGESDQQHATTVGRPEAPSVLPRKRRRRSDQQQQPREQLAPLKRVKGAFNAGYLHLLNEDIEDAAAGLIPSWRPSDGGGGDDGGPELLRPTQVGAVAWSAAEKEVLFAALGRLGRDDVAGIAARLGGAKGELEVRQYLALLDAADRDRRRRRNANDSVGDGGRGPAAAAVEVSQACAAALERAADAVALRQEAYEDAVEQRRWGAAGGHWLITAPLALALEQQQQQQQQRNPSRPRQRQRKRQQPQQQPSGDDDDDDGGYTTTTSGHHHHHHNNTDNHVAAPAPPPFFHLLAVRTWLQLADRVFMNSRVADGNWRSFSDDNSGGRGGRGRGGDDDAAPAVRATAFADLHALAVSLTRRLVLAATYAAELRIRAVDHRYRGDGDGAKGRRARRVVRARDVRAALASVGLRNDGADARAEFWARAPRRLRLDVVDDDDDDEGEGEGEEEVDDADDDDDELRPSKEEVSEAEGKMKKPGDSAGEEEADGEEQDAEEQPTDEEESGSAMGDSGSDATSSFTSSDYGVMTYDEVEAALGFPPSHNPLHHQEGGADVDDASVDMLSPNTSSSSEAEFTEDEDEDRDGNEDVEMKDADSGGGGERQENYQPTDDDPATVEVDDDHDDHDDSSHDSHDPDVDEAAVSLDVREALTYGPAGLLGAGTTTTRGRAALRRRVRAEHRAEAAAGRADAEAGARAEADLWAVLQLQLGGRRGGEEEEEEEGEDRVKHEAEDDQRGFGEKKKERGENTEKERERAITTAAAAATTNI